MKKNLSVILIVLLILGSLSLTACGDPKGLKFYSAKDLTESEKEELVSIAGRLDFLNELDEEDRVCVIQEKAAGDLTIPSEKSGHPVVYVFGDAELSNITSLTVSDSVAYLEDVCCNGEDGIESVALPSGITVTNSFLECGNLETASLTGAEEVDSSFTGCKALKSLEISDTKTIRNSFTNCPELNDADLSGVTDIFESFTDCSKLSRISLSDKGYIDGSFNNCSALTDMNPVKDMYIKDAFSDCSSLKKLKLGGTSTLESSFIKCDALKSVELSGVEKAEGLFNDCPALESVDLSGTEAINSCFNNSKKLKKVNIPDATVISGSFNNSGIEVINVPKVEEIGSSFTECPALTKSDKPDNLSKVYSSFNECPKLVPVYMSSLYSINGSFKDCGAITSTDFAKNATWVEESFWNCPALEKAIFDKVGYISGCFLNCDALKTAQLRCAEELNLYDSFNKSKKLETVSVSGDINNVRDSFNECSALKTVKYDGIENIENSFTKCPKLKTEILNNAEKEKRRKEEEERKRKEELDNEPYGPGTSALELSADDDKSACYRLLRMNGSEEFMVFLEPGESTTKYFPSGRYVLKVAEGKKWISDKEAFGSSGHYSTTEVYTFEDGYSYSITTGDHGDFRSDSASGFVS